MNFIEQCQTIAKKHFDIHTLRAAQIEVFSLISKNKYVLATLPTGAGKTLLYAVPAIIFNEGPVIVISPLISLMRDQTRRMQEANIPCVLFTSDQTEMERQKSNVDLWDANTRLVFVSPERFVLGSFFKKIVKLKPAMVVIDEAHCVIAWGHQFRPEYSEIGTYLAKLKPSRILAITATASRVTRQEIVRKIFHNDVPVAQFVSKPIGSHILIESARTFSFEEQKAKLFHILQTTHSQKSIVYFSTRKQCEDFALILKNKKMNAVVYHAGLSKTSRIDIETYIQQTRQKTVICATTAFGLGVDISDVTLVVVYGFPGNIEEFLQMIGRAGRNGQNSKGILLWTGSDPAKRNYQFKELFPIASIFLEKCLKIAHLFPASDWESRFVTKEEILRALFPNKHVKNKDKVFEGFLGALRICQMTKEIFSHEDYYHIQLAKNVSMSKLVAALPPTVTKRQKVFDGIKLLTHGIIFDVSAANMILSVTDLLNVTDLSQKIIEDVFTHYTVQNNLSFAKINSEQAKNGVILKHGFQMLRKNLDKYIKARLHFGSSLRELKQLAEAPRCRLESSFRYFDVPLSVPIANYCLQCDLCQHNKRI